MLILGVACWMSLSAQTSPTQNVSIRSQQQLALELVRTQSDRPDDVQTLLKANATLLSESFWQEILNAASRNYSQNQHDRAFALYAIARKVAVELNDHRLLARTYYFLGRSYSGLNQFDNAKTAYLESQKAFATSGSQRDLIYVLSDLATLSYIQEDYGAARGYAEQSVELADSLSTRTAPRGEWPDDYGRAGALSTLGELAAREGNISEAIEDLQRSLALYQKLNSGTTSYDYYVADLYASLGRVFTSAGDNVKALALLNKALIISRTLKNREQEASLLNSIGFLYMEQEDYAQARAQFEESLRIYRIRKNDRELSRVLLNLGVTAQRERNYEEALAYFSQSLVLAKLTSNLDVQIAASEGLGVALTGKKDFVSAMKVLDEVLALTKDLNDRTRETELLWRSADLSYEMRNYARALELAQSALERARLTHSPKLIYLATTTLGQSYAALNMTEPAIKTLYEAVDQAESLRETVAGNEIQSELFFENKVNAYHSLVDLLVKQRRPLEALLVAERAKGRVLLDVMKVGRSDLTKLLTVDEKHEGKELNRKISEINDLIRAQQNNDSTALNSLHQQLDTARLRYQLFQNALYVAHPTLKSRSGLTATLTQTDVSRLSGQANVAYLEYVITQERVYLFVMSPKQTSGVDFKVYEIAIDDGILAEKVDQFHQRLANRHPDFASTARELYATLIEPANHQLSNISTICIVPDGFLWNVPFQALISAGNRYLIEDRALYYSPSLSVLSEMARESASQDMRPASIIAFGNPVIGRDEQRNEELCPLPEAATEVTSIAKTLTGVSKKVLIGREASEQTFRAMAPIYSTIHLATHGVLDNRQPLYSHLLLTKTEGDLVNDGLLEAREIMNMNLQADLAVLSACETANGRISPGEGVMGMSWAFFVAGTRSMLVSQWKVNSSSTSKLMVNFYEELGSKQPSSKPNKAFALREASMELLKDQRYRHPFYWASFVLLGSAN